MKGIFITFEGIEGCGKTTQIELLSQYLNNTQKPFIVSREPGGTDLGNEIRNLLLHHETPIFPMAELLLFQADRNQHVNQKINPSLNEGKIVISDRYYHSSLAYQAAGREIGLEKARQIIEFAIEGRHPDVVFLIDVPVEIGFSRKSKNRDTLDKIEKESLDFHQSIRNAYLEMEKKEDQIVLLNGNNNPEIIHKSIINHLKQRFSDIF